MKIAISTDGDQVSTHFGRCPHFTLVEIENNRVIRQQRISNPGHQPGLIPRFLQERGVECIVAGGMGRRAQQAFYEMNIQPVLGVRGKVQEVIRKLQEGQLEGGESLCQPGQGKGYGLDKVECDHDES